MSGFMEVKANAGSIGRRKLVFGVGINDANYIIDLPINGKRMACPFYRKWADMLKRCYSDKYQARHPTYIGVTVCEEWLTFSVFKTWMEKQDWEGNELDKDLIIPRNKHYSPKTCCFISRALNALLTDSGAIRGDLPQGVCFYKPTGKYLASCKHNGKSKHLGYYLTPEEASLAYRRFKANLVAEIAFEQEDERIEHGLMLHAALILKGD